jgi:hypothetical protein
MIRFIRIPACSLLQFQWLAEKRQWQIKSAEKLRYQRHLPGDAGSILAALRQCLRAVMISLMRKKMAAEVSAAIFMTENQF